MMYGVVRKDEVSYGGWIPIGVKIQVLFIGGMVQYDMVGEVSVLL